MRLGGASVWLWPAGRGLDGRPCACRRTHAWVSLCLPRPGGAAVSRAVLRPCLAGLVKRRPGPTPEAEDG